MKRLSPKVLLAVFMALLIIFTLPTAAVFAADDDEVTDEVTDEVVAEPTTPESSKSAIDTRKTEIEARNSELRSEISKLEGDIAKVQAEQKAIQGNIASVQEDLGEAAAVVTYIDSQIYTTQTEITLLETEIALLEEEITLKEEGISYKQAEYDKSYALFLERLKAMYMYDNSSVLGLLLGVDDFASFLTTVDNIGFIADHDEQMMGKLENERLELEAQKSDLDSSRVETDSLKEVTQSKKVELAEQKTVAQVQVQEIADLKSQFEADLQASKAQSAAMLAEVQNAMSQIVLIEEDYAGGIMAWPTPGYKKITSAFGPRFNGTDYHTGVDISGGNIHGTNVVSANDGVVALVNWAYVAGRNYGIYVVVDHGGGITTLYAHLSNIYVVKGQKVVRGEAVGAVGNTGWSTGPHLHFEVMVNKSHKDPMGYIS